MSQESPHPHESPEVEPSQKPLSAEARTQLETQVNGLLDRGATDADVQAFLVEQGINVSEQGTFKAEWVTPSGDTKIMDVVASAGDFGTIIDTEVGESILAGPEHNELAPDSSIQQAIGETACDATMRGSISDRLGEVPDVISPLPTTEQGEVSRDKQEVRTLSRHSAETVAIVMGEVQRHGINDRAVGDTVGYTASKLLQEAQEPGEQHAARLIALLGAGRVSTAEQSSALVELAKRGIDKDTLSGLVPRIAEVLGAKHAGGAQVEQTNHEIVRRIETVLQNDKKLSVSAKQLLAAYAFGAGAKQHTQAYKLMSDIVTVAQ